MNLTEFKQYVDNLDPENADLLEIGYEFRKLPVRERNWSWLLEFLAYKNLLTDKYANISADAFRMRVYGYCKLRDKEPEEIPEEESTESKDYRDNYSEKQKIRDWYNAYRRDIREEVRIENLIEEIKLAADKFKDLPKVTSPEKVDYMSTEAVLLLSDLHIGVDCNNYYNVYNKDIALERLNKLLDKTIDYCLKNNVQKLNIINLGDMIHGIIHTNARIEAQMDVAEQIIVAGEYLSSFINELQAAAPIVTYRSVYDNHSRAIANKNEHVEKEQFSRIIDWFIRERLKDTSVEFIDNEIDGGIGSIKLFNKKALFAHGHQDSKTTSVQNFIGLTQEWIDFIFLAHYHNSAVKEFQGCKVFINGSIVGTEQYAFGRRLFSKPSQKLLIFKDNCDDVVDIDINLN